MRNIKLAFEAQLFYLTQINQSPTISHYSSWNVLKSNNSRPARTFAMSQDGLIRSTGRYTSKMGCRMDFTSFPFDEQTCEFDLYLSEKNHVKLNYYFFRYSCCTVGVSVKLYIFAAFCRFADFCWELLCCCRRFLLSRWFRRTFCRCRIFESHVGRTQVFVRPLLLFLYLKKALAPNQPRARASWTGCLPPCPPPPAKTFTSPSGASTSRSGKASTSPTSTRGRSTGKNGQKGNFAHIVFSPKMDKMR